VSERSIVVNPTESHDPPPQSPPDAPSPRAFCQATGVVFQVVGFALCLGTCCLGFGGSLGGFLGVVDREATATSQSVTTSAPIIAAGDAAQLWFMAVVWGTFVGGLAAAAVGLWLQFERPASGRWAMFVSGASAALAGAYLVFGLFVQPGAGRAITAAVLAAVWIVLFLLAGHSAELLKRFPPPVTDSRWTQSDEDALRKSASRRRRDKTNP